LTFKNKENIMGVAATQKDVLQQGWEAWTPSIEKYCLQVANNKQQTRNSNKTMAHKLTRQRRMTEAQLENLQTATTGPTDCKVEEQKTSEQPRRGPTAAAGPQLCKVESNNNNQHQTNQRKSINQ
jgi:hypothetical protein